MTMAAYPSHSDNYREGSLGLGANMNTSLSFKPSVNAEEILNAVSSESDDDDQEVAKLAEKQLL